MTAYPELRPCVDCLRVTRPKSRKPAEYPFATVTRGNAELCARCYDQSRMPEPDPISDTAHKQNLQSLLRYLAGRQQRNAGVHR